MQPLSGSTFVPKLIPNFLPILVPRLVLEMKRKCGATPLSSEPVGKSSKQQYADIAAKKSSQRAKKDHEEILWVHSTEEEKGPVSESIFFFVISRINAIKINAINNDDESHTWSPAIKGQPIYDHVNQRGKIVCTNKQTVDFWVIIYRNDIPNNQQSPTQSVDQ